MNMRDALPAPPSIADEVKYRDALEALVRAEFLAGGVALPPVVIDALQELAALKARRCDGCAWYLYGDCTLAAGDGSYGPDHADSPMQVYAYEGSSIYLRVAADHACNAWQPRA